MRRRAAFFEGTEDNRRDLMIVFRGRSFEHTQGRTTRSSPGSPHTTSGKLDFVPRERIFYGEIVYPYPVQVRKVSGNNPFTPYGVINDGGKPGQRSGDGAFLLSQP